MKRNTLEMLGWPRDVEYPKARSKYHADPNGKVFVVLNSKGDVDSPFRFDVVRETLQGALNSARASAFEHREWRMDDVNVIVEVTRRSGRALFTNLNGTKLADVTKLGAAVLALDGERCENVVGADGFLGTCVSRSANTKCNACIRRMERVSRSA